MGQIQLPQGASLDRTLAVTKQVEALVGVDPAVANVLPGYSLLDGSVQSNSAFLIGRLKPFTERATADLKVNAVIRRVAAQTAGIPRCS